MFYQIIPPPEILKGWVRNFWVLQFSNIWGEKCLKLYADPYPSLTFQCNNGKSALKHKDGTYLSNSFLAGVKTKPSNFLVGDTYSHVAVSFYPNAVGPIFNIPPDMIVDQYYDLKDLCPKSLLEKLYNSLDFRERLNHLIEFLVSKVHCITKKRNPVIEDCVFGVHNLKQWNVTSLTSGYKMSERQLERKFYDSLGISPKKYLRIIRFERALTMLQSNSFGKLSNIAFDLGYSDQAAFTNDFRNSSGFSPKIYLATNKAVEYGSSFLEE